jgi:creatinine amidohydrolase
MVRLLDLPHAEARRVVASGAPVYLPVNPVEFHGPHLSLHNDRLVSEGLIGELHARLQRRHPDWPLLVASDLEVGVEPTPGLGSRLVSFRTTRAVVREACRALAELGAQRVLLMTFHGAPLHNLALDAGVRALDARGVRACAPFVEVLRAQLDLQPERFRAAVAHLSPADADTALAGLKWDFHAGFFETSLALLYAPESVAPSWASLPPCPPITPSMPLSWASRMAARAGATTRSAELAFGAAAVGWHALDPFPGYTGHPAWATAAAGRVFADAILDTYEPIVEAVFAGARRAPGPFMPWVGLVSGWAP